MVPLLNPSVTAVTSSEGQSVWVFGDCYTIKVTGAETQNAFALVECRIYPDSFSPPHLHHAEDEMFYILEGTLILWAGGKTIHAGQGTFVHIPKGTIHTFKNESDSPVRALLMLTPAGFEQYFLAVGIPVSGEHPTPPSLDPTMMEMVIEIAPAYQMEVMTAL